MKINEIEQQIDVTRHELDLTLQALHAKLSPRLRMQSALGSVQRNGRGAVRTGVEWAAGHPLPILLAGAALLIGVVSRAAMGRHR